MPMASSSSTCIMSSECPESTDIDLEQAQQKSASMLNVLRALMPADIISMECTNGFDYSCFGSWNRCPLAETFFGVTKMKHNWSKQQHNYHNV